MSFDPGAVRPDFPALSGGRIYLDNACMTLKPRQVLEKMRQYYEEYPACAGRSHHTWAQRVEDEVAGARAQVRKFVGARHDAEIVFTRNTTEGINLVAGGLDWRAGDEVVVSDKEHNSNWLPWLRLRRRGVAVKVVPTAADGTLRAEDVEARLTERTRLVALGHTSNLDGATVPLKDITKAAHRAGARVLADAAQSLPGGPLDVRDLGVDFLAASGHKMLGPTGTGVLYGHTDALEALEPLLLGGGTVTDATLEGFELDSVPARFEAGLQDYAGLIGLGEACRYLDRIGMAQVARHKARLNRLMTELLASQRRLRLLGPLEPARRGGIFSFSVDGMDPHRVAGMLDASRKIAVRAGAHCVHAWFNARKLPGSVRASVQLYNTEEEVGIFAEEVQRILAL